MKISIITCVLNNEKHLEDCIKSVLGQSHSDVEHIVVDGGSTDGSLEIIKKYEKYLDRWISEPDSGIYDAMNKGIILSTGSIIGLLNSDDLYSSDDVLSKVSNVFEKEEPDCCYGDIVYMSPDLKRVVRYWQAGVYKNGSFRRGWMPPHPSLFVNRGIFNRYGMFRTDFEISADYELMLRFFEKGRVFPAYISDVLVKMRVGGRSNSGFVNLIKKSFEDYKAWKVNNLKIDPMIVIRKPLSKLHQFYKKQ
ncbi:MAG: glycosyltransferase [Candidatus Aminicenantes bacterium]|nr:glycosyltransferase [Candidatus Aminicenantes bacterium]